MFFLASARPKGPVIKSETVTQRWIIRLVCVEWYRWAHLHNMILHRRAHWFCGVECVFVYGCALWVWALLNPRLYICQEVQNIMRYVCMGQEEKQDVKRVLYSTFCRLVFKHNVCEYIKIGSHSWIYPLKRIMKVWHLTFWTGLY